MDTLYSFFIKNVFLTALFITSILIWISFEIKEMIYSKNSINPTQAIEIINHNNAIFIDSRNEKLFNEKHIINSINIPLEEINDQNKKLKKYRNKTIIVIQTNNFYARKTINILKNLEFKNILYMNDGINSWNKEQLPTTNEKE
ncbi:MAG TPA: rhodanese-like domain-containing protein [Candidatus Azoamicus sp. OHIO1]